jgi:hypothetical protein
MQLSYLKKLFNPYFYGQSIVPRDKMLGLSTKYKLVAKFRSAEKDLLKAMHLPTDNYKSLVATVGIYQEVRQ